MTSTASVEHISIRTNKQKEPWFINTLNPNGRIPVLVDRNRPSTTGAEGFAIFETAAILLYLSQHYDPEHKLWFDVAKQPADYSEMLQWIFFAVRLPFSNHARPWNRLPFVARWRWPHARSMYVEQLIHATNSHSSYRVANHFNKFAPEDIPYAKKRQYIDPYFQGLELTYAHRIPGRDQASLRSS